MTTISDTMKTMSRDIQNTFEELFKLLLRKSIRPVLNPLGQNNKIIYNTFKNKYERGFVGSSPEDNISKYTYTMTNESLGWNGETLANLKITAKFAKSNILQRFPAGNAKTHNMLKSKTKIAFSDRENGKNSAAQFNKFLTFLTSRNMQYIITNKNATFSYTTDIPYTHTFKQLESIGRDILNETEPSISGEDSAKMSTAMLRVKLYNLEQNLANMSVNYPFIFDAYVEMLRIINSVPKNKIIWVINLIASLSYRRWEDLPETQQKMYTDVLGEDFINAFNNNELITILLQSGSSEYIVKSAYLYALLKMLFIVFGYSKLVPIIIDNNYDNMKCTPKDRLKKHFEKYRGASIRRNTSQNMEFMDTQYGGNNGSQISSPTQKNIKTPNGTLSPDNLSSDVIQRNSQKPYPEPIDQYIFEFIKLFGDLYPTIVGLMGGTENFPESFEIRCNDIPSNYDLLCTLPEYLWRFNDYSYCRYLEYVGSRQLTNAVESKINAKVKYLQTI